MICEEGDSSIEVLQDLEMGSVSVEGFVSGYGAKGLQRVVGFQAKKKKRGQMPRVMGVCPANSLDYPLVN